MRQGSGASESPLRKSDTRRRFFQVFFDLVSLLPRNLAGTLDKVIDENLGYLVTCSASHSAGSLTLILGQQF